jgi:hypothetical protein
MQDEARELSTAAEIKIDELHRALECHIAGEAHSWSREERKQDGKKAYPSCEKGGNFLIYATARGNYFFFLSLG